jgi:hypothetical protein
MTTQNEISDYFKKALASFENDPPDTPHTEGYHDALVALLAQHGEPLVPMVTAAIRNSEDEFFNDRPSQYAVGWHCALVETLRVALGNYDRRETVEQLLKRANGHALH